MSEICSCEIHNRVLTTPLKHIHGKWHSENIQKPHDFMYRFICATYNKILWPSDVFVYFFLYCFLFLFFLHTIIYILFSNVDMRTDSLPVFSPKSFITLYCLVFYHRCVNLYWSSVVVLKWRFPEWYSSVVLCIGLRSCESEYAILQDTRDTNGGRGQRSDVIVSSNDSLFQFINFSFYL